MTTKAKWVRSGEWQGGYRRQRQDIETGKRFGPEVFVIEKWVSGKRFHVSTRCTSQGAAMRQLVRFEADPAGYSPAGAVEAAPELRLTDELVAAYWEHQVKQGHTREWADEMSRCLADWTEAIGHLDLRHLRLHHDLKVALEGWPKRKSQRIKALKGFFRWLRTERGLLRHAEDATLDLRVPQASPEKWRRRKVVAAEDVQSVLRILKAPFADILHVLTATAWHVSEVRRFAETGELVRVAGNGAVRAVLMTRHKGGEMTRTPLQHEEHIEAALRLQERVRAKGWPNGMALVRAMKAACLEAGVPDFRLGVMRHSVLTWAHEAGAPMGTLRDFAQHKSEQTTRRFYVDAAVPVATIPVRRFQR